MGNNRVVIDIVIQRNDYYPCGMEFADNTDLDEQPYRYNGKELDKLHGLNMYDYSARYMEPAIGQFTCVDPLAEKYYNISPYVYCANNPMKYTDPNGKAPWIGAVVGAAIDYGFQVGINYMDGKSGVEAWTYIDMPSIAVSAVLEPQVYIIIEKGSIFYLKSIPLRKDFQRT